MRFRRLPKTICGQWITTLTIVGLIIAPFGCETANVFMGPPAGNDPMNTNPFGLLINTDTGSDVLGGVRLEDGRSVWVYGSFNPDGSVREITGAGIRDAEGQEAGIILENGLPKSARAFDGSTADFTYDEVSDERLMGRVTLDFADSNDTQTVEFDVDPQAAAADLARLAADLAGLDISDVAPPSDDQTASKRLAVLALAGRHKGSLNESTIVFVPAFAALFAVIGYVMVLVMVQVMEVVMVALVATVIAVTEAMVIAMFAPFIIMGDILRLSMTQPRTTIRFTLLAPHVVFRVPLSW